MTKIPILFFLLLLLSSAVSSFDLTTDRAALLSLRRSIGGSRLATWNATTPTCDFRGVACDAGRVTSLRLPGSGLLGQIPAGTLGNLTALKTLSLRFNSLSGPIPDDLPSSLRNLYLQRNRFSGTIPADIPRNIVRLDISSNTISGPMSSGFSNLTRLRTLYLQNNSLSGQLPADLALPNLALFNASFNSFNGSIPANLRKMPANAFLGMSVCGGPLPPCPGEVSPSPSPSLSPAGGGGGGVAEHKKKKKLSGAAIAGITIGCAIALAVLILILILLCYKKDKSEKTPAAAAVPAAAVARERAVAVGAVPAAAGAVKAEESGKKLVFFGEGKGEFDLEDLLRASAEVLGKGTFGTAYKAVLEMGIVVVVKRLKDVALGEREFGEKIEGVGALNHPNIVPLKAYYYNRDEKLLVYEYMPLGSLSALLHGNRGSGRAPLNWTTRSAIALASARGISYIHSTSPSSSHGNIKSSNILLGSSTTDARVSDHGLAHLIGAASSSTPARMAGYRAPEVTDPRRVSQKADVYSFGVLLLELLTGKAPAQAVLNEEGVDLPRWVQSVVREEWTSEVFDSELVGDGNDAEEEMVRLLQLGVDCAAQYPDNRPSMEEVVVRIEEIRRSAEIDS